MCAPIGIWSATPPADRANLNIIHSWCLCKQWWTNSIQIVHRAQCMQPSSQKVIYIMASWYRNVFHITGPFEGNPLNTGAFPSQMTSSLIFVVISLRNLLNQQSISWTSEMSRRSFHHALMILPLRDRFYFCKHLDLDGFYTPIVSIN